MCLLRCPSRQTLPTPRLGRLWRSPPPLPTSCVFSSLSRPPMPIRPDLHTTLITFFSVLVNFMCVLPQLKKKKSYRDAWCLPNQVETDLKLEGLPTTHPRRAFRLYPAPLCGAPPIPKHAPLVSLLGICPAPSLPSSFSFQTALLQWSFQLSLPVGFPQPFWVNQV